MIVDIKYKLEVDTFSGKKEFDIKSLVFVNGIIDRAYVTDENGVTIKFKNDEEEMSLKKYYIYKNEG